MTQGRKRPVSGFVLDDDRLPEVKKHLSEQLEKIRPSLRLEIFARCVGFRTYASLRAAMNDGPVNISQIDIAPGLEFCASKDIGLTAGELSSSLEELVSHLGEGAVHSPANR